MYIYIYIYNGFGSNPPSEFSDTSLPLPFLKASCCILSASQSLYGYLLNHVLSDNTCGAKTINIDLKEIVNFN